MAKYNTYVVTDSGERVDLILDRGNRRCWKLSVSEGRLTVRVPMDFRAEQVKGFVEDNIEWIHSALGRSAERCGLPLRFEDGERIRLLGEELTISLRNAVKYFPPRIENGRLLVAVCGENADRDYVFGQVQRFILGLAEREIFSIMRECAKRMALYPKKVTIKDMSASWGRCSSGGNISINYKVVTYSRKHIEYVCIHELAHLVHMDHGREFWELVGKFCPDCRELRAQMRT